MRRRDRAGAWTGRGVGKQRWRHPSATAAGAIVDGVLGRGVAYVTSVAFGRRMAQRGRGSIVNIASIAGMRSMPLHAYAPAKAALIAMTECLAAEWGRSGVRVNAVLPGYTRTPALQAAIDKRERDVSALVENSALGRMVEPKEVARAVAFLASADAA